MSIVPLVKVTLYGPVAEKEAVLDGLQRLGCVHLEDLRPTPAGSPGVSARAVDARAAWQYLHDSPVRRKPLRNAKDVDLAAVAKEALEIRDRSRALVEEGAQLRNWIADLEPWGDFELPEWARGGELRFWFYVVPLHEVARVPSDLAWRVVAQNHRFAYVVVMAEEEPATMPVAPVVLDPRSLTALRARRGQVERELEELDYRRIGLTLYRRLLAEALDEADDGAAREWAAGLTLERDQLFAVRGWTASERAATLRGFARDRKLALTIEAPGPRDAPPTLLHNPAAVRGGEDLVTFYKTPAYAAWDPSQPVFWAFAFFFGMILSDAGYGLLLVLLLLATWKRLGESAASRGFRGVLAAISLSSVVYGVLVGSYFGVAPPAGSWPARLRVLDTEDQSTMMWLVIGIGAAHLGYANLVAAWRGRRSATAPAALGWACIILGGFCAGIATGYAQRPVLSRAGLGGVGLGALLVLLFTSERPFGLAPKLVFGRLVDGLGGLTGVSKAFGDVLSYLRLFALGLASIKLADAFNGLAGSAFTFPGVGLVFALLILAIGHTINLAMGIMGGVVHGLRLNVIEFFDWSLRDDGMGFRAFAKKAEE